jgi:mono/diheme cytochrome c family protein
MGKFSSILAGVLLAFTLALSQDKKEAQGQKAPAEAEWKVPPEEAQRPNPVKPTAASIAEGKNLFSTQCVMCHGAAGDGKGDLAVELKMKLRDYRDPAALKGFTDGELRYVLVKGKGQMPGQEGRMKEAQLWNLVNYMRSLARTEPPAKAPAN